MHFGNTVLCFNYQCDYTFVFFFLCRYSDLGFIIYYTDDANIHQCLGLASVATVSAAGYGYVITPPIQGAK